MIDRIPPGGAIEMPLLGLRRFLFFGAVVATTVAGSWLMLEIVGAGGVSAIEVLILLLFAPTFGWISVAFWTSWIGFVLRALGRDPLTLRRVAPVDESPLASRTALVMPVHNEEPERFLGALGATIRSLIATGEAGAFDVFLLSDTTDPSIAREEESAWRTFEAAVNAGLGAPGPGRLIHRRRAFNVSRKAGNIAEFCERWGDEYDFMVILDADSVMSGETLVGLARTMERFPRAALIQTVPLPARQETLFGRILQFGAHLQSSVLATGQAFWQGDAANYWGHNAIVRVEAFRAHAKLPVLPGAPPLGGEVLSHDFVEAALLRRAGWHVYLMPHMAGSFEEVPENIPDYARRDRRWAQGSLQHLRLLGLSGLHPLSRVHFVMGAMGYISSVLWGLLLVAGTAYVALAELGAPFVNSALLFGADVPHLGPVEVSLLAVTAVILFVPKWLGLVLAVAEGRESLLLVPSALLEVIFAVLTAPILMIYHTRAVVGIVVGKTVGWGGRTRGGAEPSWRSSLREAAPVMAVGLAWSALTLSIAWTFFLWLTPVLVGLVFAVPIVRWSGTRAAGTLSRRLGMFVVPSETDPTHVVNGHIESADAALAHDLQPSHATPRRRSQVRNLKVPSILVALTTSGALAASAEPALAQASGDPQPVTAGPAVERTYGLGLPRDMDVLYVPDTDYPDWPLLPEHAAYADVSGERMKDWVERISAISLQSQADGNMYWGRLPGTIYDEMTMDLMTDELERLGFTIERDPFTIPTDWSPTSWEASYTTAGGRTVELVTAFPAGETAGTSPEGITAEAVWVGVGAEPDFLGRDVRGKAVIIYSTFVPGGRSHSASDRAGIFDSNTRASELGAAMIINVMGVPGNGQFNPLGAPPAELGVPMITISQDEGFALRDVLGSGERVDVTLRLDVQIRENVQTENVLARLPGASDEEIVVAMHTDGYFQAAMDNASGMASGLEIARHYASMPQAERPRSLLFVLFPDHHHGEVGLSAWEEAYNWDNVALALTLEHPSQTLLYWYNEDLMTSNAIGAFRWNAMGSPAFLDTVTSTLRDFGVSLYTVMDGGPKLTSQAPGFHIIDHVIYHTTLDVPELVPAEGMERATRAFLSVIDQANRMTLQELRSPGML
jgi:membrane glycosyltransferase